MIRQALPSDISGVMAVVEESRKIMQECGNFQWDENYPLREHFEQDIIEGALYVIEMNGVVAGLACLNGDVPEEYSKALWQSGGEALVIHRMAVSPEFRGRGFGRMLLDFARKLAKEKGAISLRTDTFSGNIPMNTLFSKHGFRMAGAVELLGKKQQPFYCYEKILGENSGED